MRSIGRRSCRCRETRCRKRRGRFTVTGTPIQDDTIRKQESTNEAERFTYIDIAKGIGKMYLRWRNKKRKLPGLPRDEMSSKRENDSSTLRSCRKRSPRFDIKWNTKCEQNSSRIYHILIIKRTRYALIFKRDDLPFVYYITKCYQYHFRPKVIKP